VQVKRASSTSGSFFALSQSEAAGICPHRLTPTPGDYEAVRAQIDFSTSQFEALSFPLPPMHLSLAPPPLSVSLPA
jgi:hypothetical protein